MTATVRAPLPSLDHGRTFVARPVDDPDWRLEDTGRPCSRPLCRRTAVVALNRRRLRKNRQSGAYHYQDAWWRYCAGHLADYHKWIENGRIMAWEPGP